MTDTLAGCGLDEGLELKQLIDMSTEDLNEDILADEDLGLDDDTKERFRTAVLALRSAAAAEEAKEEEPSLSGQTTARTAFEKLLGRLDDDGGVADVPEAVPPSQPA